LGEVFLQHGAESFLRAYARQLHKNIRYIVQTAHHCTLSLARLIQSTTSHPQSVSQQKEGRILYVHLVTVFFTVIIPLT